MTLPVSRLYNVVIGRLINMEHFMGRELTGETEVLGENLPHHKSHVI
jgi:hypothetical protein